MHVGNPGCPGRVRLYEGAVLREQQGAFGFRALVRSRRRALQQGPNIDPVGHAAGHSADIGVFAVPPAVAPMPKETTGVLWRTFPDGTQSEDTKAGIRMIPGKATAAL